MSSDSLGSQDVDCLGLAPEGELVAETDPGSENPPVTLAPGPAPAQPADAGPGTGTGSAPPPGRLSRPASAVRRRNLLVSVIPAAVALVVGGYELGSPSLWRDEAYTKDAIGRSLGQLFAMLAHQDAVHGAYYVLMYAITPVIGTSTTALRVPSLIAMVIATGFTAAVGRRAALLARGTRVDVGGSRLPPEEPGWAGRLDVPALTGLLSGLLFAIAPYMTFYAQMARSYAIETMFATIATYLLTVAYDRGQWRWWWAYGVAIALTGLFNLFGVLLLAAHAVTLLIAGRPARPGRGRWAGPIPLRWLAVSAVASAVLVPLLIVMAGQQEQIAWLSRPNGTVIQRLLDTLAGAHWLVIPFALLGLAGLVACCLADNWRPLNPAAIALPWLAVPPVLLIAASFVKPVYYIRYVEFCLPALAILAAAGLTGLARLAAFAPLRRARLAWLAPALTAVIVLGLAVALIGPQRAIRQTAARPDNLRGASAIVAAHERPGDVVFYIPMDMQVLGTGYPAPFRRLRNIALAQPAVASATLTGREVTSPAVLKSRFTDVGQVWVITGASNYKFPVPATPVDREKMTLIAQAGLHVLQRWHEGEVMLTLYGR
jgi:mannosyltransferase